MAKITVNDIEFAYDEVGERSNPTIVFTHSLLWARDMFSEVVAELADGFHIINLDQHGHGESGHRATLTLENMAEDCSALLDALDLKSVHWAGLSMGGMLGMRLALSHPEKVKSLTLMDTSSRPEMEERRENYFQLAGALRAGMAAMVADTVLQFYFAPSTYADHPELIAAYREKLQEDRDPEGIYQAALAVFNRDDITDELGRISVPALVMVGDNDIATPLDRSELLVEKIPDARLVIIPNAAHMSATEQPALVASAIRDFVTDVEAK